MSAGSARIGGSGINMGGGRNFAGSNFNGARNFSGNNFNATRNFANGNFDRNFANGNFTRNFANGNYSRNWNNNWIAGQQFNRGNWNGRNGNWSGSNWWGGNRYGWGGWPYWAAAWYWPWWNSGYGYGGDYYGYDYPYYYQNDYGYDNYPVYEQGTAAQPQQDEYASAGTQDMGGQYFAEAAEAFHAGDYRRALKFAGHAAIESPQNPKAAELMSLASFALGDYRSAAMQAHAALAFGPKPDWNTVYGYYGNVNTYAQQLRALERYSDSNPKSADAHFVLAYQYLITGYTKNAAEELDQVVKLTPQDKLASEIADHLSGRSNQNGASDYERDNAGRQGPGSNAERQQNGPSEGPPPPPTNMTPPQGGSA